MIYQHFTGQSAQDSNQNAAEKEATDDIIDDDDDDDLEPIETMEAPIKCNVAYVRDFIETLSEDKPYEERLATFSALPNVVKHQIKHEHPQVSHFLNYLINISFSSLNTQFYESRIFCLFTF